MIVNVHVALHDMTHACKNNVRMYKRLVTTETNRTHIQDYTLTLHFDTHSEAVKTKY